MSNKEALMNRTRRDPNALLKAYDIAPPFPDVGIMKTVGFEDSPIAVHVMPPNQSVPGSEFEGSRLADANIRVWRVNAMEGPVVAEAAMDRDSPETGYCTKAWSLDHHAHSMLMESIQVWLKNERLSS